MGFLLFLFVLVGFVYLYSRMRRAEDRLNQDQYERSRDSEVIAGLTRRVWALEQSQAAPRRRLCQPRQHSIRHRLLCRQRCPRQ